MGCQPLCSGCGLWMEFRHLFGWAKGKNTEQSCLKKREGRGDSLLFSLWISRKHPSLGCTNPPFAITMEPAILTLNYCPVQKNCGYLEFAVIFTEAYDEQHWKFARSCSRRSNEVELQQVVALSATWAIADFISKFLLIFSCRKLLSWLFLAPAPTYALLFLFLPPQPCSPLLVHLFDSFWLTVP